jgi:hypothetical protein
MSMPRFLVCFYLTFTVLLAVFSFSSVLYCQNCHNTKWSAANDDWQNSGCEKCHLVDQFDKKMLKLIPDIRAFAETHHLQKLENIALLFGVLSPATIEIISLLTLFLLVSFAISTT